MGSLKGPLKRSGNSSLLNYNKLKEEAQNDLYHYRIFLKSLCFLTNYKKVFRGSYEIFYNHEIFKRCFIGDSFKNLSLLCDKFRAKAVNKENQNDILVDLTKSLEFCEQIAVLKRALGRREGTAEVEPNMLQDLPVTDISKIIELIPQTFVKIAKWKNSKLTTNKGCLTNAQKMGGSAAILNYALKDYPEFNELIEHHVDDMTFSPTVYHFANNVEPLKNRLIAHCMATIERYHTCDDPANCQEWDKHMPVLMIDVTFRGGKVRQLSMALPELQFLGGLVKKAFKKITANTCNADLFVKAKYYYSTIMKEYKEGDIMHSGDFESCTNRYDTRHSRQLMWEVFKYCTGSDLEMYRKIIFLSFSHFKIYQPDPEIIDARNHAPLAGKTELILNMLKDKPFFRQLSGQHMGITLSFWMMGIMHAICEKMLYPSPTPKIGPQRLYEAARGKKIAHKDFNPFRSEDPEASGFYISFGDDVIHMNKDQSKIDQLSEIISIFNQRFSKKGNFVTKEGMVFTERTFTRRGGKLYPLLAIKSKLLFKELGDFKPYFISTIRNLMTILDQEFDLKYMSSIGLLNKIYKKADIAKSIMMEGFKRSFKNSKLPIHVPAKFGGLGIQGSMNRRDHKWCSQLQQYLTHHKWEAQRMVKRMAILEPKFKKQEKVSPNFLKVHEGENLVPKSEMKDIIYRVTGAGVALIEPRRQVEEHFSCNDIIEKYNGAWKRLSIYPKTHYSFKTLNRLIKDDKLIGVDDMMFNLFASYTVKKRVTERQTIYPPQYNFIDMLKHNLGNKFKSNHNLKYIYYYIMKYLKQYTIKDFEEGVRECAPFEYKSSLYGVLNYEPFLPYTILVYPVSDSGQILDDTVIRIWNDARERKIGDKRVFYRVLETSLEDLSDIQKKFLNRFMSPGNKYEPWNDDYSSILNHFNRDIEKFKDSITITATDRKAYRSKVRYQATGLPRVIQQEQLSFERITEKIAKNKNKIDDMVLKLVYKYITQIPPNLKRAESLIDRNLNESIMVVDKIIYKPIEPVIQSKPNDQREKILNSQAQANKTEVFEKLDNDQIKLIYRPFPIEELKKFIEADEIKTTRVKADITVLTVIYYIRRVSYLKMFNKLPSSCRNIVYASIFLNIESKIAAIAGSCKKEDLESFGYTIELVDENYNPISSFINNLDFGGRKIRMFEKHFNRILQRVLLIIPTVKKETTTRGRGKRV
jgi:nicotinamide mononucleotide adenylyltransferase